MHCPSCGAENPPGFKFCGACGRALSSVPTDRTSDASKGERRQLTVMFCDLVSSTELAARLDPEDWGDIAAQYQRTAAEGVTRFGGHVAKYLGDGVVAYFGYPQAHDDDVERAVRAGLTILDGMRTLNLQLQKGAPPPAAPLRVRVGLHTGPVVMSPGGGEETEVFGEVPHVAARVQALAEPDSVLITGVTQRLVAGIFVVEDRGAQRLKGIPEPVPLYRVLQPSGVRSRLDLPGARLTQFIGRDLEAGLLLDRWDRARKGGGQAVLVMGEAGVGKSRLVHTLRGRLAEEPHTWLECRSAAYTQHSAFRPVIELVEQGLAFSSNDTPEERITKLERGLGRAGFSLAEAVPLFAALLSMPLPDTYAPLQMSPDLQRRKTIDALVAWILAFGESQPALLLVEDLHWCDPSSLELLGQLLEQIETARVMMVCAARPEFPTPWPARSNLTLLNLNRLTKQQTREMAATLSPGRALPPEVVETVVARADGIPLYVEELTRMVLESGLLIARDGRYKLTGALDALAIPATLQDSLMARLDRLSAAKEVAQRAAALGREFSYALLAAVAGLDEPTLRRGLADLVEAELLFARGAPPEATYIFKHVLIQDTAYQSLLKRTRQRLHAGIAQVLEEQFPARAAAEPEVVARHYEAAGLTDSAVARYERAGEQAAARSAHQEAIVHLRKAIALLVTQAESAERNAREVPLQLALGSSMMAVHGYGHWETETPFARALALCERAGSVTELTFALTGLSVCYTNRGEPDRGVELAARLLEIGQQAGDEAALLLGHTFLAWPEYFQGKFASSLAHAEQTIALYEPSRHHVFASRFLVDPGVSARPVAALSLWNLGYPDRALRQAREAVALARTLQHPHSIAHELFFEGTLHGLRGDTELQRELMEQVITLSEMHGFPMWLSVGKVFHGAARAISDKTAAALEEIAEGLELGASLGSQAGAPALFALLAEAQQALGQYTEALGAVETGLAVSAQMRQFLSDADLHRLKGDLLLASQPGSEADAERLFHRALEIARAQAAKCFELRAATSLARLLRAQGKGAEGRALLAPIYNWFTEGFDTADLQEAKALLAELS